MTQTKTKVVVTGGSGGAGNAVIKDLLAHGYDCVNLDIKPPRVGLCPFIEIDMTDYKAVHAAMEGADMVVHFAGNPHPDDNHWDAAERFNNNTAAVFNAFNAARAHGIKRVVWASSETIFGFPFETNAPDEGPLTEEARHQPQNGYAISKAISETVAEHFAALYDMTIVGLRLSNVLYDDVEAVPSFQKIPGYWDDVHSRRFNLWGYIDDRDTANAVRLSLEADITGAEVFSIAAPDSIMNRPSREIFAECFPNADISRMPEGRPAALDCSKAERVLGWKAEYTWADVIGANGENA